MSPQSTKDYLRVVQKRYKNASKKEKSVILDEVCQNLKYHRKHAIRTLRHFRYFTKPKSKKKGRKSRYNKPAIIKPLKEIWRSANLPCSIRLKAILPLWLPGYIATYGALSDEVISALIAISASSIDRALKPTRIKMNHRGRSTTKPGALLKKQIPIKTNQWDESRPGFLEADTVAHCGTSLMGMFAYSVDFVDIATGWTEQRAVWGKGETGVLEQIKDVEKMLPFPMLGFDSDNGSEFLNHHLLKHFAERKHPVQFTRSRPYHKDDNAHIEQKNWTHVRQWLGYDRLDHPDVVPLINNLYRKEWRLFHNFFCPSVKLLDKQRVASKTIKHYDSPKTPYQRVLESPDIPDNIKEKLKEQMENLNPFELRKKMEKKLKKVISLCSKNKAKTVSLK